MKAKKGLKNGRVDDLLPENVLCDYLADFGFSANAISKLSKLSTGQISYRLKRSKKKLRDFRNGETEVSKTVIDNFNYTRQFMNMKNRKAG